MGFQLPSGRPADALTLFKFSDVDDGGEEEEEEEGDEANEANEPLEHRG